MARRPHQREALAQPARRVRLLLVSSGDDERGVLVVPLRGLAVASAAVALTCLAALVVVASIKDVDTLSTVALSLAVIAFVAQLIVFVVQTGATSQQMLQSRELHAELLRLLGEMGERTKGTEAAVTRMDEKLLEVAIEKTFGPGEGSHTSRRAAAAEISAFVNEPRWQAASDDVVDEDPFELVDPLAAQQAQEFFSTFPPQAGVEVLGILRRLTPTGLSALARFGRDAREWSGTTLGPGLSPSVTGTDELVANGLLMPRQSDPTVWILNDIGRDAARLLTARNEPPAQIAEALAGLDWPPAPDAEEL